MKRYFTLIAVILLTLSGCSHTKETRELKTKLSSLHEEVVVYDRYMHQLPLSEEQLKYIENKDNIIPQDSNGLYQASWSERMNIKNYQIQSTDFSGKKATVVVTVSVWDPVKINEDMVDYINNPYFFSTLFETAKQTYGSDRFNEMIQAFQHAVRAASVQDMTGAKTYLDSMNQYLPGSSFNAYINARITADFTAYTQIERIQLDFELVNDEWNLVYDKTKYTSDSEYLYQEIYKPYESLQAIWNLAYEKHFTETIYGSLESLASLIDRFENHSGTVLNKPSPTTGNSQVIGNSQLGYAEIPSYFTSTSTDNTTALLYQYIFPDKGESVLSMNYTSNLFTSSAKEYTQRAYSELSVDSYFKSIKPYEELPVTHIKNTNYITRGETKDGDSFAFIVIDNTDRVVTFTIVGHQDEVNETIILIQNTYQY